MEVTADGRGRPATGSGQAERVKDPSETTLAVFDCVALDLSTLETDGAIGRRSSQRVDDAKAPVGPLSGFSTFRESRRGIRNHRGNYRRGGGSRGVVAGGAFEPEIGRGLVRGAEAGGALSVAAGAVDLFYDGCPSATEGTAKVFALTLGLKAPAPRPIAAKAIRAIHDGAQRAAFFVPLPVTIANRGALTGSPTQARGANGGRPLKGHLDGRLSARKAKKTLRAKAAPICRARGVSVSAL